MQNRGYRVAFRLVLLDVFCRATSKRKQTAVLLERRISHRFVERKKGKILLSIARNKHLSLKGEIRGGALSSLR